MFLHAAMPTKRKLLIDNSQNGSSVTLYASIDSVFLDTIDSRAVAAHETSIPIVVIANKWNQFGSLMFSVKYQPTRQEVGPNSRGSNKTHWRFLVILARRSSVPVTKSRLIGIELFIPLNASGIEVQGTFCFRYASISGFAAKRQIETSAVKIASPWVNRKSTNGVLIYVSQISIDSHRR
jgi:hypothetical protein